MIIKKLMLVGIFTLIGCSQSNNNPSEKIDLSYNAGVGIFIGSGDFGELSNNNSKILTLKISNTGDAALVGPPVVDNANFSIVYQNGCASIAPKKSCSLKVSFDSKGKVPGSYSANLNLDTAFISLTATIPSPIVENNNLVDFLLSKNSVTSVDFGQLTQSQSILKTIELKNIGNTSVSDTVVVSPPYSLVYDGCSGKSYSPGKNCFVKVSLSGVGKSGVLTSSLEYSGKTLSLIGEVFEPLLNNNGGSVSPDLIFISGGIQSSSLILGTVSDLSSRQTVIYVKNIGNAKTEVLSSSINNNNFSILFDQCSARDLAPSQSCQMRLVFSGIGKTAGTYSSELSLGGKTLPLSYPVSFSGNGLPSSGPILKLVDNFGNLHKMKKSSFADFSLLDTDRTGIYQILAFDTLPEAHGYFALKKSQSMTNEFCESLGGSLTSNNQYGENLCQITNIIPTQITENDCINAGFAYRNGDYSVFHQNYSDHYCVDKIWFGAQFAVGTDSFHIVARACSVVSTGTSILDHYMGQAFPPSFTPVYCGNNIDNTFASLDNDLFVFRRNPNETTVPSSFSSMRINKLHMKASNNFYSLVYSNPNSVGIFTRKLDLHIAPSLLNISELDCTSKGGTYSGATGCSFNRVDCLSNGYIWETPGQLDLLFSLGACRSSSSVGIENDSGPYSTYEIDSYTRLLKYCGYETEPSLTDNEAISCTL